MLQQWSKWVPAKDLTNKYYIESIIDNKEGLTILLHEEKNKNNKMTIKFEALVASYSLTNETFKLETISFLTEKYGENFYGDWTFFKVTYSPYLQLLSQESSGISNAYKVEHFVVIDPEFILDVIAPPDPAIELFVKTDE